MISIFEERLRTLEIHYRRMLRALPAVAFAFFGLGFFVGYLLFKR